MRNKTLNNIINLVAKAYKKRRKIELSMSACPRCQFEQYKNGVCGHCGKGSESDTFKRVDESFNKMKKMREKQLERRRNESTGTL